MIHRHKKESGFVIKDTHASRNRSLSWQAKGVHDFLMQLPPEFKVTIEGLVAYSPDGRTCCRSAMNELIKAGYVIRTQKKGERGKFGEYEYHVFERPEYAIGFNATDVRFSDVGLTDVGLSDVGKPDTIKVLEGLNTKQLSINSTTLLDAQAQNENKNGFADSLSKKPVSPSPGAGPGRAAFAKFDTQAAFEAMPDDQPVLEAFVRRTGLKSSDFGPYFADFRVHISAIGRDYPGRPEFISHFLNWSGIRAEAERKRNLPPTPGRASGRQGSASGRKMPVTTDYDNAELSFRARK